MFHWQLEYKGTQLPKRPASIPQMDRQLLHTAWIYVLKLLRTIRAFLGTGVWHKVRLFLSQLRNRRPSAFPLLPVNTAPAGSANTGVAPTPQPLATSHQTTPRTSANLQPSSLATNLDGFLTILPREVMRHHRPDRVPVFMRFVVF